MSLDLPTGYHELVVAAMSALSVFLAFIVVAWPYLARDTLAVRLRRIAAERERIRARERERMMRDNRPALLRTEPRRLFADIVARFNLRKEAEDGELVRTLRMAGFRGRAPVVTFVAVRLLMPLAMLALAAFYIFLVVKLPLPFLANLAIVLAITPVGYFLPALYVRNRITRRQQAIRRAWPDALDLLLICVESGMGIESAFRRVAEEMGTQSVELAEELSLTTAELSYLQDRRVAYENLAARTDLDGVRAVVTSLIQSEKYGTPLGHALRVMAQENRDMRMSEAEKKAAALPPKLTVPMIIFFLPVLFAVIATPAAIQIAEIQ